jgi:hypothetical protein
VSAVHATQLHVSTRGLVLPNGLRLASIDVDLPTPVLQIRPQIYLPEGTVANIDATIDAADIQTYLEKKQPGGVTGIVVKAEDGFLTLTGYTKLLVTVQIGAQGKLQLSDGKLNFIPTRAEVGGVKMPDTLVRERLDQVNPIIDLPGYPLEAQVRSIEIADGRVRLAAQVSVTAPIPRLEP